MENKKTNCLNIAPYALLKFIKSLDRKIECSFVCLIREGNKTSVFMGPGTACYHFEFTNFFDRKGIEDFEPGEIQILIEGIIKQLDNTKIQTKLLVPGVYSVASETLHVWPLPAKK